MKTKLSAHTFKRVLSVVMVLVMVLSMLPVTGATAVSTPDTLCLEPSNNWKDASGNAVTVTENTFSMPASAVTVTAVFKDVAYLTVYFRNN